MRAAGVRRACGVGDGGRDGAARGCRMEAQRISALLAIAAQKDSFLESVRAEREKEHRRRQLRRELSIEDTLINVERQKKREAFMREQTCVGAHY